MEAMTIEFHGVRGSLAAPGARTVRTGGNTSCVEVRAGGTRILLDAGTGIRAAGERLLGAMPLEATVLLSHLHWDHIQGLPFFTPLYVPGNRIRIVAERGSSADGLEQALRRQMSPPFFPVAWDDVAAQVELREVRAGASFDIGRLTARAARLNHPDPVCGWRLEHAGCSVVYATDTEHYACIDPALKRLAQDADVLVCDAQYTPDEYSGARGMAKVGWGHSTWEAAVELAQAANVRQLVLFHHDPQHSDDQIDAIEEQARERFPAVHAAREGMVLTVGAQGVAQAGRPAAAPSAAQAG